MNTYIHAQILNMQAMVQTFERSCEMAAMKDDGKISRDEEKQLKKNQGRCTGILQRTGQSEKYVTTNPSHDSYRTAG